MTPRTAKTAKKAAKSSSRAPKTERNVLGITAFILSIVGMCSMLFLIGAAGYIETSTPGGVTDDDPAMLMLGLLLIANALLCSICAVLGITSLFLKGKEKIFGALGISFSVLPLLLFAVLLIIGLNIES